MGGKILYKGAGFYKRKSSSEIVYSLNNLLVKHIQLYLLMKAPNSIVHTNSEVHSRILQ